MTSENPNQDKTGPQTKKNARDDAANPKHNPIPEVKIPPPHSCYTVTCQSKRDKWDIAKLVAEFVGLGFLSIPLIFTNIGKLPIKNIEIESRLEVLQPEQSASFIYSGLREHITGGILFPTRHSGFAASAFAPGAGDLDPPAAISPELRNDLSKGTKWIAAYAHGSFTDDLGGHWFQFCTWFVFNPTNRSYQSGSCVHYNNVGDLPDQTKQ